MENSYLTIGKFRSFSRKHGKKSQLWFFSRILKTILLQNLIGTEFCSIYFKCPKLRDFRFCSRVEEGAWWLPLLHFYLLGW